MRNAIERRRIITVAPTCGVSLAQATIDFGPTHLVGLVLFVASGVPVHVYAKNRSQGRFDILPIPYWPVRGRSIGKPVVCSPAVSQRKVQESVWAERHLTSVVIKLGLINPK